MTPSDYIYTDDWFAWHPVKCDCGTWVMWTKVRRTIDERPLVYLGLVPEISYRLIK